MVNRLCLLVNQGDATWDVAFGTGCSVAVTAAELLPAKQKRVPPAPFFLPEARVPDAEIPPASTVARSLWSDG